mgnify:CR=1 FL=1|jgi:hypothetical protein
MTLRPAAPQQRPSAPLLLLALTPATLQQRRAASPVAFFGRTGLSSVPEAVKDCLRDGGRTGQLLDDGEEQTTKQVASLWTALIACYGTSELALQAARQNPSILKPAYYSSATVIADSRSALIEVMGDEAAALHVMVKNPAILQCGSRLRAQTSDQIASTASLRQIVDRVPRSASLAGLLLVLLAGCANIVLRSVDSESGAAVSAILGPLLGASGGGIFVAAAFAAAKAQGAAGPCSTKPE